LGPAYAGKKVPAERSFDTERFKPDRSLPLRTTVPRRVGLVLLRIGELQTDFNRFGRARSGSAFDLNGYGPVRLMHTRYRR
jgi:hypothetical protein